MNAFRSALSVTSRVCPRTGLGILSRRNATPAAELYMSAAYTTPPRTRPDESSIKNCLKPDFRYGSKHAGWTGAGLVVGAGVLFGAGLYKTTLKSAAKEPVDDRDKIGKTGLHQVVVDDSPVGVLTKTGATSSSAAGLQSGTTGEADVQVDNGKDPVEETEKDAEDEVPTQLGEVARSSAEDPCADDSDTKGVMTSHAILSALPKNDPLYPAKPPQQPQQQLHGDHIWMRFLVYILIYMGYVKILPARFSAQAASTYGRTAAERFGRSSQGGASRESTRRHGPWT
ncbi:uncharacterized protein LOC144877276 [Branchiostoma floridae x Branchiostoma japonicum]